MTASASSRARSRTWIKQTRSPRYDIWVSRTQVASPWFYRPECMALWDEALGLPMTELDGESAGSVAEEIKLAAKKLRNQRPTDEVRTALQKLEWMLHLIMVDPRWVVRVETPAVVSFPELVDGVLANQISRDEALKVACERGGSVADIKRMLNMFAPSSPSGSLPGGTR